MRGHALGIVNFPNGRKSRVTALKPGRKLQAGYVLIYSPRHPGANSSGYIQEHRIIAEALYGGPVPKFYIVHHKDENKSNNVLSNLEVMTRLEHSRHHKGWMRVSGEWFKPCGGCKRRLSLDGHFLRYRDHGTGTMRYAAKCHQCRKASLKADNRVRREKAAA